MLSVPLRRRRSRAGFTMIEVVVSIGLVGVSIVAALNTFTAMSKTDVQLRDREYLQRLAIQKYDEIVATGGIESAELNGDFSDRNDTKNEWRAEVTPSGVDSLDVLTVTVKASNTEDGPQAVIDGLVYDPNAAGTTGTTGGTTGQ